MLPSLLFWTKLTVAFTCTSLPLNLYTSVFGCGYCLGFEKQFWRNDGFDEKKTEKNTLTFHRFMIMCEKQGTMDPA